jgi:hypothetical protein
MAVLIFGMWKTCCLPVIFGIWESDACLLLSNRWERVRDLESHAKQNDMYDLEDDGEVKSGLHTGWFVFGIGLEDDAKQGCQSRLARRGRP